MNNRRSASVGALPVEKKHFVSRNESASGAMLDVRCACQYFQCESLLPDRANPVESRPTSKQGFVNDMDHHFDNTSARSFNMMGRQTEFDRISAASFGGRMHGMEGRGLVVRSISDATEPEMVGGGMMAGHRGRQMSIGGISSGSFGGRDPDAVSIRSGISLRRVSRSPSHADLFVADLNIPAAHAPGHSIPRLNIVAPTPTPSFGNMSPPDFSIYDRKSRPLGRTPPNRWREDNKENLTRHHERLLPQNKPIDISMYAERNASGRVINEPMDVDVTAIEPVIDIKDNIRIDRMSPPLDEKVPDVSPVVEDETRIEIRDFAPQPDLRPVDEILADDKPLGHFDSLSVPGSPNISHRQTSPSQSFQLSQLKRQHGYERDVSPDYSKKQFMQRGSPAERMQYMDTGDFMQRGSPTAPRDAHHLDGRRLMQRGSSPAQRDAHYMDGRQFMQQGSSPAQRETQHVDGRQFMQYGSTPSSSPSAPTDSHKRIPSPPTPFQRGSSPAPAAVQHMESRQFMQRGSPSTGIDSHTFQTASSPASAGAQHIDARQLHQSGMHHMDIGQSIQRGSSLAPTRGAQPFQRASSPSPAGTQQQIHQRGLPPGVSGMHHMDISQSIQRGSSPAPTRGAQPFQRASSPSPAGTQQQIHQRGLPPVVSGMHHMDISQSIQRGSSPARDTQPFQRASSPPAAGMQPINARQGVSGMHHMDISQSIPARDTQPFQRASSPPPAGMQYMNARQGVSGMHHMDTSQSIQRASSPAPNRGVQPFQRASSPAPASLQPRQLFQNGSHPAKQYLEISKPTEQPHDDKQSYSSRFMSMFHSKTHDQTTKLDTPPQEKRKLSMSHLLHMDRRPSVSPGKQLRPDGSPMPGRLMSVFMKNDQPRAMSVVEGTHVANMSIRKAPEDKLLSVKVTETFSLKVDEMDQYSSRPRKSPSPVRHSRLYASSDQLGLTQDRLSGSMDFYGDRQEAFAPVIVPSARSSQMQLQAGDRSHYMSSSQTDLRSPRRLDPHEHIPPAPHTFTFGNNKKLVSVPIALPDDLYDTEMTSSEFIHDELEEQPNYSQAPRANLSKTTSEQRLAQSKLLQRKAHISDRTQSHDRAAMDRASELDTLSVSTRSKTVSFSFGDRDSRLSQHEKLLGSNDQLDKKNWLERTYFCDHEYEPIGEPAKEIRSQPTAAEPLVSALKKESSPAPQVQELPKVEISQPGVEVTSDEASSPSKSDELKDAEELQKDIEDRYFSSAATSPSSESRTEHEIQTSQVDSSALEELPMQPENKKKGFMASAQDRTRKMQAGLKNQAGKIKTKFRSPKKVPSGSPKAKERKRFKAPEFSKIKMPEMKRPDLSGFKRPEFTKFSKPDMSKFKLPDKFSSLKLTRSKSLKEPTEIEDTTVSGTTPESTSAPTAAPAKKPKFDFSFGTYPRAFKKKKKPQEVDSIVDEPSVIPSTETQPSAESSSTPQGDRGPGPVRSRWADKFSDVSYNDSEGSRYRRYGSEPESSFDRESSMERRMKDVQDENAKEEAELAMLSVVEKKQFDDYDEENRVIHEISKTREGEFKRRPIVHQDSDLVSEEGRDIGWTEREAQKIQILRKAELEAEAHLRYLNEMDSNPETHSTASSKKMIFEEINDDEFLLRKKGISQEFNIGNQRFLDPDMEAGFDNSPNALEFIGVQASSLNGSSIDRIDYGYDVPPPKPRRLSHQQRQRHYDSENASQIDEFADDISLSQAGSDYYKHAAPSRPLRKGRFKHSQEISIGGTPSVQFDEEEYDDQMDRALPHHDDEEKENILQDRRTDSPMQPPQAPRRRRKQLRDSMEKDSYVNGFGGRSVSNSYLREDNKPEEVIVYRTEHEYKIPLATPENYTDTTTTPRKSRSLSRTAMDEDDHTSRGADSLALDTAMRGGNNNANLEEDDELQEKYIIEMMENDGYAIVRKENLPKPTPPARRKKFSRSPGERFATMPHLRRGSPAVQELKSSSRNYSTIGRPTPPRRKSAQSLGADSQKEFGSEDFGDYEVPELDDRTESPRNLQSGDIINRMKYRPLPPPPRPPREKRHIQRDRHGDDDDDDELDSRDDRDDRDGGGERIVSEDFHEQSSDDYNLQPDGDRSIEVEVSTQTDPLPDDFVCEEFEITEDMKVIEPRRAKTLDEILKEEEEADLERARQIDDEVLVRGIQRFREANQRSASEKSRASSQAKSLSRPQTPSAILIEKRVPTPVPYANGQTVLEASLTVQPIDDLDLEEEMLRREGLYDGSHSKSGSDGRYHDEEEAAHGSEEENARIGEEERSYTRSTDAESQRQEEEDERDRKLVERLLEAERLQEEEEEQKLLEELEREERLLEAEKQIRLLEEEERELRLLEEEKQRQRLLDDLEKEQRLRPDNRSDEHDSYDDERTERLKPEDSYELKSEVSEERETTPAPPPTPPISPLPPTVEEVVSVLHEKKLLAQPKPLEQSEKYEPEEEPPSPPPTAPPRKRSTAASPLEELTETLSVTEQGPATAAVPITSVMPSHLTLADLEVERLRVHALQAGQIMVSHLHGAQIQADELECRSGNLVVRNIELPPGFIEDIVERVRTTEREQAQVTSQSIADGKTQTEQDSIPPPPIPTRQASDVPPVRPPPPQRDAIFPSEYMQPSPSAPFLQRRDADEPPIPPRGVHPTDYLQSVPPIGFFSHRNPDDEDEPTPPVYRRRRHHRRRDSSSEEDHQRRRSRSARPEPQTVAQAGRQFISACSLPLTNVINQLTNSLRPNNDNKQEQVQPRNISAALVLFIVMALTILIYLLTGRNIHHHHWDYFNPPGNDGRLS